MKNKFLKLMTVSLALSSCLLVNSCKGKESSYVDNSYKTGDNNSIAKILGDLSKDNDTIESKENSYKNATQFTNSTNINGTYFTSIVNERNYIYRFTDGAKVCDVTDSYAYGSVENYYAVYNRVTTDKQVTLKNENKVDVYKTTIYGHIYDTNSKSYDFDVTYYSATTDTSSDELMKAPSITLEDDEVTITQGSAYLSLTTDFSKEENKITVTPNITNEVIYEEEEEIDSDKLYKYNGYTYVKEINEYIKYVQVNNNVIVYHKDESGNDLTSISVNQNAYQFGTSFIWQEDITIAEKNEETSFTYYDASGNKHLLKTYCSKLDGSMDATEIETKFKFNGEIAENMNYLVLNGYDIKDNKVLDSKLRNYFIDSNADLIYKTSINDSYSNVVKISDNLYKIGNNLFDANLNFVDSVTESKYEDAFISSTAVYDINGNVIAKGSYSEKYGALYDNINEKYYGIVDNKLVEYSGKYYGENTWYNLDIIVSTVKEGVYKYQIKSLDGSISNIVYASTDSLTFSYAANGTTTLVRGNNSTIYSDAELSNSLAFILFTC